MGVESCLLYRMVLFLARIWKCPGTCICFCPPFQVRRQWPIKVENLNASPNIPKWVTEPAVFMRQSCNNLLLFRLLAPCASGSSVPHSLVGCGFLLIFVAHSILTLSGLSSDETQLFLQRVCLSWRGDRCPSAAVHRPGGSGLASIVVPCWLHHHCHPVLGEAPCGSEDSWPLLNI